MKLVMSEEVKKAVHSAKPVVALESTIITHGMSYPKNIETAFMCEEAVREMGAIPATCAVINGKLCAGLSREQIEELGKAGTSVIKGSRRDLPILEARKLTASATVSATMVIAAKAGVRVFATGGVGGVHSIAEQGLDISSDMDELSHTPVAVVCAGIVSVLDTGKTLEYLGTKGVPVVVYGSDEFPGFYTRSSGYKAYYRSDDVTELSNMIRCLSYVGTGMIIANPIPKEAALEYETVSEYTEIAVSEAKNLGIASKELTPFILKRVAELSKGKCQEANIALLVNNARLAARIAKELYVL